MEEPKIYHYCSFGNFGSRWQLLCVNIWKKSIVFFANLSCTTIVGAMIKRILSFNFLSESTFFQFFKWGFRKNRLILVSGILTKKVFAIPGENSMNDAICYQNTRFKRNFLLLFETKIIEIILNIVNFINNGQNHYIWVITDFVNYFQLICYITYTNVTTPWFLKIDNSK